MEMKNFSLKIMTAAAALCAALVLSTSAVAQQSGNVYAVMAGSSALTNTLAFSAFELNSVYNSYLCGKHHWTYKSTATLDSSATFAGIHDDRSSSIQDEPATVVVSWNDQEVASGGPTTGARVCAYAQVDSTVGVRAAFARDASGAPAATFVLNAALVGVAGQNKIPNTTLLDEVLPQQVYNDVNNAVITIAAADIRPEDAKFATTRTLISQGSKVTQSALTGVYGLGYTDVSSASPSIGYAIKSSQSATVANPVDFALYGTDPISSGNAPANFKAYQVGAGPVMVFVNTSSNASYHLGDTTLTDITGASLSKVLDGTFVRTRDLFQVSSNDVPVYPLTVFLREPLSGTYNTLEFDIPNTWRFFTTQEKNVVNVTPASGSSDNPLNQQSTVLAGAYRKRTVGTGEMVSTVLKNADSLGYAFWGYGNFSGATLSGPAAGTCANNCARYLTVDGVDPLYSGPSANPNGVGVFPLKTNGSYPVLSFPNIVNGAYPIWTIFRLVTTNPSVDNSEVQNFITVAQGDASTFSDFIPATNLQIFRSHFYQANIGGDNGHVCYGGGCVSGADGDTYYPEYGGDMGGQVYPIQADYDYINDSIAKGNGVKQMVNLHN
jgi:hypothetical protein